MLLRSATLASLGDFAGKWEGSLFEALFSPTLHGALDAKAIGSLHEFGRCINDLEYRARHTTGGADAKVFLLGWLKDIGCEQHLHDAENSEKLVTARWGNVLDFIDWVARRCGGELTQEGATFESKKLSLLQVAQTIIIISIAERGDDSDAVTLSTLHAAKGLEWAHVQLPSVNEGLLHFKVDDESLDAAALVQRLEGEHRLMERGITRRGASRARHALVVSTLRRRKRGRDTVAGVPSRFIAEMKLDEGEVKR